MPQSKKAMAAPAFVFIKYSDPAKDRKAKSNKHLVTKHATIHACKSRRRKSSNDSGVLTPSPRTESEQHDSDEERTSPSSRAISQRVPSVAETPRKDDEVIEESDDKPKNEAQAQDLVVGTQGHQGVYDPAALFTLMSCTTTDPFDTLPVKTNHQIWKLLNGWLNAGNQVDAAEDGYRMQVAVIRKCWFWPMVNRNKATFNAAVAWIAASTGDRSMEPAMTISLAASLPALRETLLSPRGETAESAWYSIILLLAIAMRTGDMDTVYAHYMGLASLLSRRPDFVTSPEHTTIPFTASFLYTFVASVILANYDAYRQEPSLSYLPYYVLATGQSITNAMAEHEISTGFTPLFEHGVLSSFFYSLITHIIPLQSLARAARQNNLTATDAAALLNAIWCCQLGLYIPKPITTEIEENIWIGVMMYWHLERQSWSAVDDLALALSRRLQQLNIKRFVKPGGEGQRRNSSPLDDSPHDAPDGLYTEVLLWLSICAGTFVRDREAKTQCGRLTTLLAWETLGYSDWNTVHRSLRRFFWTDFSDDMARRYWSLCPMTSEIDLSPSRRRSSSITLSSSPVQQTQQQPFGTLLIPSPMSVPALHCQSSQPHQDPTYTPLTPLPPLSSHANVHVPDPQRDQHQHSSHLPCQFCRQTSHRCRCRSGRASPSDCPDHLRGSLWAVPPSIFAMLCRPVWVPHDSRELPESVMKAGVEWHGKGSVG